MQSLKTFLSLSAWRYDIPYNNEMQAYCCLPFQDFWKSRDARWRRIISNLLFACSVWALTKFEIYTLRSGKERKKSESWRFCRNLHSCWLSHTQSNFLYNDIFRRRRESVKSVCTSSPGSAIKIGGHFQKKVLITLLSRIEFPCEFLLQLGSCRADYTQIWVFSSIFNALVSSFDFSEFWRSPVCRVALSARLCSLNIIIIIIVVYFYPMNENHTIVNNRDRGKTIFTRHMCKRGCRECET